MKSIEALQHRIDFILVSKNLSEKSISATVIRTPEVEKVSDHYPLIAKF
jgi:endonuclease/exonuclease/phosphatase family metal-dependent hydrolase